MSSVNQWLVLGVSLFFLAACSPPSEEQYAQCYREAQSRGKGHGLSAADLGELTEACMARRGFVLKREGKRCGHNLQGESNRRCYFQDNLLGRLAHDFVGD